jgi:hypothetical protein
MDSMLVPTAQTLEQIVSLQRSWWRQYLTEFAKLVLQRQGRLSWPPL